jgi:hypothetical protein
MDEKVEKNPFWQALQRKEHAALMGRIEKKSLIVLVPVAAAIPSHVNFDKYYFESHIFEPSTYIEGEYVSLNKKSADIRDKKITTRKGENDVILYYCYFSS